MKSREILPLNKRLDRHQKLALEGHTTREFNSNLSSLPSLLDYDKALTNLEQSIEDCNNEIQDIISGLQIDGECSEIIRILSNRLGMKFNSYNEEEL